MFSCPNGCVASMARSDFSVIGTWKDDIKIDQEAVKAYVAGEFAPNAGAHSGRDWGKFDLQKEVIDLCPSHCMSWDGNKLSIDTKECVRCMHCINTMPRALHIGDDRGASILVGAKAPILDGAQMGSLLVPSSPLKNPSTKSRASSKRSGTGGWKKVRTVNVLVKPSDVSPSRSCSK